MSQWDTKASPYLFVSPYFILFAIFGLFPLGYTFWVSLHDWPLLGEHTYVGLQNYRDLMADDYFRNALVNTLGMFVLATVPQILLALALAALLDRNLRMRTFWRLGILLPTVTSVAAVGIIFSMIFSRDTGVINFLLDQVGVNDRINWKADKWSSWLAISTMVDWRWTGYNALILLAALQAVPRDLYEAAEVDGASKFRQFWSITIPMLRPTLIFVVIIATIGGIQLFTEPLLFNSGAGAMQGGTTRQFQTAAMYLIENGFTRLEYGYASAIAWLLFAVIAVVSAINLLLLRRIRGAD
uniref:ABC transporter, permease protein 1 (Cluster 1, maltose/g3p/polyamine/iron) n=1 Tax=uncultured Nocardioidaceae bacterium TaxID=253824 RepID=A0A6J4LH93_9ACTN|nr:MAG: ABC transporter, permease protein 1 (cluster 1, maltose/g3p/polyamine/iron) [uncultured Nocardioidaceae bacterium]